jgi:hypothetical protein
MQFLRTNFENFHISSPCIPLPMHSYHFWVPLSSCCWLYFNLCSANFNFPRLLIFSYGSACRSVRIIHMVLF